MFVLYSRNAEENGEVIKMSWSKQYGVPIWVFISFFFTICVIFFSNYPILFWIGYCFFVPSLLILFTSDEDENKINTGGM